jgi:threonine dehydrogenase-like Zn-dependent dehydrogenase
MRQVLQNYRTGEVRVDEVPAPALRSGAVLVTNRYSLISAGTERMKVETGKMSLLGKARSRPDLVKKVLKTLQNGRNRRNLPQGDGKRLESPSPLGYSCAGEVIAVGSEVEGIRVGDRVACAGAEHAHHAEIVCVPQNLVALIPDGVPYEHAAFTTVGAIALHGVRQADVQLGDAVVVIGLGLGRAAHGATAQGVGSARVRHRCEPSAM